jgi:hypothetical protein
MFCCIARLLRGREGYALVTLQAALHFLNMSQDVEKDIFWQDTDEENVPLSNTASSNASPLSVANLPPSFTTATNSSRLDESAELV